MRTNHRVFLAGVLLGFALLVPSGRAGLPTDEADGSSLAGDWKGESVVVAANTSAKDEVVVWHIAKGKPGKLIVNADKIVNGNSIAMGWLEFTYDKETKAMVCEYRQGVWKLVLSDNMLKGTLTRPDKTVLRRVSLERAK